MTPEELKKLDADLADEEKELEKQLAEIAQKNPAVDGDYEAKVPDYGPEMDENAQEVTDFERNAAMVQELEPRLKEIRKAREKIAAGTYGKCDNCSHEIPKERLHASLTSALCISCARKSEV